MSKFDHLDTWSIGNRLISSILDSMVVKFYDLNNDDLNKLGCQGRVCSRQILGVIPHSYDDMTPSLMSTAKLEAAVHQPTTSFSINEGNYLIPWIMLVFRISYCKQLSLVMFRNISVVLCKHRYNLLFTCTSQKENLKERTSLAWKSQMTKKSLT